MRAACRRGGIYIAVLAVAMIVTVIGLAGMAAWRLQGAAAQANADTTEARNYAEAGIDYAANAIANDANWRSDYSAGAWFSNVPFAHGKFSVSVADPVDGVLSNRPYDAIDITSTGNKGSAVQLMGVRLMAVGTPLPALGYGVCVAGQFHVASSVNFTVSGAPASTNTSLYVQGTLTGSAQCTASISTGTITGGVTVLAPSKTMPPSTTIPMYQALGTTINYASGSLDKAVLGPGVNSLGGGTNAEGVYVLNLSGSTTIKQLRVLGTLVIICSSPVTLQGPLLIQPYRADYPALIVQGGVAMAYGSSPLSESSAGTNFNPAGMPYNGVTDSDQTDTYPCEIDGLVHVTGTVTMSSGTINGAIICESNAGSNALYVTGAATINYLPSLYTSPPMGYTSAVSMKALQGSWKQAVLP